jgi:hypothetical protein
MAPAIPKIAIFATPIGIAGTAKRNPDNAQRLAQVAAMHC